MTLSSKLGTAAILSATILLLGAGRPCLAQSAPAPSPSPPSTIDEHLVVLRC
jgi:hypothetical protein